jgi:diaminopimelate epimerase
VSGLRFIKVEGLGNDFVLIDRAHLDVVEAAWAIELEIAVLRDAAPGLCDRHRGIGADGVIVIAGPRTRGASATMIVINADGSRPQMCGNGLRCVAAHLARASGQARLVVDTDRGPLRCVVTELTDAAAVVDVDMGPPEDLGEVRPAAARDRVFRRVSMGNPHAVTFVGEREDPEALARRIGPAIETDPAFPDRTNVELARLEHDGRVILWVWERGVGITAACGTGACATVAAGCLEGKLARGVRHQVVLPGGPMDIEVPGDPRAGVRMRGPARVAFEGIVEIG